MAHLVWPVADALAIQYLIGEVSDDEMRVRMGTFMPGTTGLFKRFTIASQTLLPAVLSHLGGARTYISVPSGSCNRPPELPIDFRILCSHIGNIENASHLSKTSQRIRSALSRFSAGTQRLVENYESKEL